MTGSAWLLDWEQENGSRPSNGVQAKNIVVPGPSKFGSLERHPVQEPLKTMARSGQTPRVEIGGRLRSCEKSVPGFGGRLSSDDLGRNAKGDGWNQRQADQCETSTRLTLRLHVLFLHAQSHAFLASICLHYVGLVAQKDPAHSGNLLGHPGGVRPRCHQGLPKHLGADRRTGAKQQR